MKPSRLYEMSQSPFSSEEKVVVGPLQRPTLPAAFSLAQHMSKLSSPFLPSLLEDPVNKIPSICCSHQENNNIYCFGSNLQTDLG